MNTKINNNKTEAKLIKTYKFILLAVIIILSLNNSKAQTYLDDDIQHVPVFDPDDTEYTERYLFWDLTEINNTNNRLDIGVGVNHIEQSTNYRNGNWYKNENNTNFNSEVTGNRFIYLQNSSNTINGFIFSKLNTTLKNAVVTRGSGDLEIYENTDGAIGDRLQFFHAGGSVFCDGKFSTDTLSDVLVLSDNGDTVKLYKGIGDGTLDATVFYRYSIADPTKIKLAQISNYIYPYSVVNSTTSDRDELIYREGQYIKILKNNNNNTFSSWISIDTDFDNPQFGDFKITDVNNDGYNDIIVSQDSYGIKVYVNDAGESFSLEYENLNPPFFNVFSVNTGDFNKDGFNDLLTVSHDEIAIYLNTKDEELFEEEESSSIYFEDEYKNTVEKSIVADLNNKGGLSVIFSGVPDNILFNQTREILRANTTDTDAVPAPAYIFKSIDAQPNVSYPKLLLYSRGDRDFNKFKIYKKSQITGNSWTLIDSTTGNSYTDYNEQIYTGTSEIPPNCFYYVKVADNTSQLSVNSDTIPYTVGNVCCIEYEDNLSLINQGEIPNEYVISNYPNPFNPTTKINYAIPKEGIVNIIVFNSLGQEVIKLVNEFKSAGRYNIEFNGSNLSSGIYYYRIEAGSFIQTKKMLLIK